MEHYVPASLENITRVTEYVLREENEKEIKIISNKLKIEIEEKQNVINLLTTM